MPETINLIPQEERVIQTKTRVVKFSTIFSIVLLIIVASVSGFYFYRTYTIKQKIKSVDSEITSLRSKITGLSGIEINARNLYKKTEVITSILKDRLTYSKLLSAIKDCTPDDVKIVSFALDKDRNVAITGSTVNYNAVQEFSTRLLGNKLFTEVELSTVTLDASRQEINFFLTIKLNRDLLHE